MSESVSPDGQVIAQLKLAGSNLSKEHPIEFFIYAPTKESANEIAGTIAAQGFKGSVEKAASKNSWLVYSVKNIVPTEDRMRKIRASLNAVASSVGGEYDGWGTPIVK
ncbi:ribonuclease E inhibitor RraB [Alkalimarinus coralli]|uniref:ribonuclease E inhibitor RraB n=1 Tax=Alkalimarinus coralli TaxID=2935863 RepID=UPI00202B8BD2|nr:ribonuclease E inhibitor RraB [Alkalimarinus coralli]